MRPTVPFLLVLLLAAPVSALEAPQWRTPPTMRLVVGFDGDRATPVTLEGTPYDSTGVGFGAIAGVWFALGPVQPFFEVSLFSNFRLANDPCRSSAFDPDTLVCEDLGPPLRMLGAVRGGVRIVPPLDDSPSRLGVTLGAQYFVQSLYSIVDAKLGEPLLPYLQVDWAADKWLFSAAAGFGGYVALEVATSEHPLPMDHLVFRLERLDLNTVGPPMGDVMLFVGFGMLDRL